MTSLHALPDLLVFPIVAIPFLLAVVCAPYIRRGVWPGWSAKTDGSEVMDAFIALASATAVVLTLSLVNVEGALRQVEERAAHEAAVLDDLDRSLVRYGDPRAPAVRMQLKRYGEAIVAMEWPLLHEGQRSTGADAIYGDIGKGLAQIEPDSHRQQLVYAEALRQFDELSDLRDQRVEAANEQLPAIYWLATLGMASLMILIAALNRPTIERSIMTGAIAGAIGLLVALVVIFDAPFEGSGSVTPAPFERVLQLIAARQG